MVIPNIVVLQCCALRGYCMPEFDVSISEDKRFVIYRPDTIGGALEDFVRRRQAVRALAEQHDVKRVLLDYRGKTLSVNAGFFEAALSGPRLRSELDWRIAVVISIDAPSHSIELAHSLSEFLRAMKQEARTFYDYSEASDWLMEAGRDAST
jgi:hypothetical protein